VELWLIVFSILLSGYAYRDLPLECMAYFRSFLPVK